MTWELGHYEDVADQLRAASELAVDRLDPVPGELVIDVGCGTGNASLILAARGARVLAIDPTPRLLGIAQLAGRDQGLAVHFEAGDAASIPVEDGTADAIVSVFAVIFAPDAPAAAAEMSRSLRPEGRMVLTAWLPNGALGGLFRLRRELIDEVRGTEGPSPARFEWHDLPTLRALLGPLGFAVELEEAAISFTSTSVQDYLEAELRTGPLWVEARSILEPAGRWSELRDAALRTFRSANEDPSSFQLTSRYIVATARARPSRSAIAQG